MAHSITAQVTGTPTRCATSICARVMRSSQVCWRSVEHVDDLVPVDRDDRAHADRVAEPGESWIEPHHTTKRAAEGERTCIPRQLRALDDEVGAVALDHRRPAHVALAQDPQRFVAAHAVAQQPHPWVHAEHVERVVRHRAVADPRGEALDVVARPWT